VAKNYKKLDIPNHCYYVNFITTNVNLFQYMKILYVSASPMGENSHSRNLSSKLIASIKAKYANSSVIERDLNKTPVPHLNLETLTAFNTPVENRTLEAKKLVQLSDSLIEEINESQLIIIASPMWNFGVPSVLKAWIDHISRAGITFKYTETGPVGLISGKKAIIVSSRGGIYSQGVFQSFEHEESHIASVLQFLGISDVKSVRAEGVAYGKEALQNALKNAEIEIANIVKSL
jgi:FMN-dependent NADH-azoreductase